MTKEKYLQIRDDNAQVLYSFYTENIKPSQKLLTIEEFVMCMQMWPNAMVTLENVRADYDIKFELMTISDVKTGNLIKYV